MSECFNDKEWIKKIEEAAEEAKKDILSQLNDDEINS